MYAGLIGAVLVSAIQILIARVYTGLDRVDYNVKELGQMLLIVFALYAPVKVENMILGGGIIRSGGNTKIIMIIDTIGTWCIGIPLCMFAAYVLHWEIVGVYTLLTTEEIFRLIVSLVIFKKRKWMIRKKNYISSWQLIIVAQFQISRIIKIILQNIKSGKAGDNLKNLMSAS